MPTIDKDWWEHLTPKPMHRRLKEFQALLVEFCATPYGRLWLTAATEHGVLRVRPGQFIPVLHMIALADQRPFIAPQRKIDAEHRSVGHSDGFISGKPMAEGELAIPPMLQIELVTDPIYLDAVRRRKTNGETGITQPSQLFSIPAHMLLSPKGWIKKSFVLYQHIFGAEGSYPEDGYFYVGVTTRSWQKRWSEHRRSIETGSPLLFHRRFRDEQAAGRVTYIHHKVMGVTDDIEELYNTEEFLIEGQWEDERRLNMIPGGKSGLKYLREHGLLATRTVRKPEDRYQLVEKWLRENPRRGLPAPWVAEKWKDDEWAIAQICGRTGRLSVEQVRSIRHLANEHSVEVIADRIGALNKEQVQRVLDGQTYSRIS